MSQLFLAVCVGAAAAAAGLAGYAWAGRGDHPVHGAVARLSGAICFWATCQALWTATDDPQTALRLVRLAAFGWIPVGPLMLGVLRALGSPAHRVRTLSPLLGIAAGLAVLDQLTPWGHPTVEAHSWGWSYQVGPLFPVALVFVLGCIATGLVHAFRDVRRSGSPAERHQLGALLVGYLLPTSVGTLTDGLLPMAGLPVPQLATASFVATVGLVVWTARRFGYSLLAPHAFTQEILDLLRDGVALLRPDGCVRHANAAFAKLAAEDPETLPGRPIGDWIRELAQDPGRESCDAETELQRADGRAIPVALTTLELRDRQELPLGVVVGVRDLREVVALRQRVITSGRLAAVGELAAGIAHEINNPLAYLRSNLTGLRGLLEELCEKPEVRRKAADFEEGRELVEESLEGVDRIARVVRDLRTLSGPGDRARELVDVNALLEAALRVLQPHLRFGARVERRLADLPRVAGSAAELQHVFLAVLLNAGRALGERGTVEITSECSGDEVCIRIRDDGCGMPPDIQERVFDPFFTTHAFGEAGGLGLAVAWHVVRQHGGSIALESAQGRGTCVDIRLPVAP